MKQRRIGIYELANGKFQVSAYSDDGSRIRRKFSTEKEADEFSKEIHRDLVVL